MRIHLVDLQLFIEFAEVAANGRRERECLAPQGPELIAVAPKPIERRGHALVLPQLRQPLLDFSDTWAAHSK